MTGTLLLYNLKLNFYIFSISLNKSLIIFIRAHTVNYRNSLNRLCVRMNIILFIQCLLKMKNIGEVRKKGTLKTKKNFD